MLISEEWMTEEQVLEKARGIVLEDRWCDCFGLAGYCRMDGQMFSACSLEMVTEEFRVVCEWFTEVLGELMSKKVKK